MQLDKTKWKCSTSIALLPQYAANVFELISQDLKKQMLKFNVMAGEKTKNLCDMSFESI